MKHLILLLQICFVFGCQSTSEKKSGTLNSEIELNISKDNQSWYVLKEYDQDHLTKIALPVGGIGTGTVSLGGRGDLRDWEIMNRPAKGFTPVGHSAPFFCIYSESPDGKKVTRVLEGPVELSDYENSHGSSLPNHGLPRFQFCSFESSYPFGRVKLSDPNLPVDVHLEMFNPLVPGDANKSSIPIAVFKYTVKNKTSGNVKTTICGNLPNFIGNDGWERERDWGGNLKPVGEQENQNEFRKGRAVEGIFLSSEGVSKCAGQWGTITLTSGLNQQISYRTAWEEKPWGGAKLDFWDDFSADGKLENRQKGTDKKPMASLAVSVDIPANREKEVVFYLTWHFPNRITWTPSGQEEVCCSEGNKDENVIGNYYCTLYQDAWDVAEQIVPRIERLKMETVQFVNTFCESNLPEVVKEAALFNLSTLRSQTCFRTPDGRFYGFGGCHNEQGCCHGSCTHVWNYEQATAFLFGDLAKTMREVEFAFATDDRGMMNFRVNLPLEKNALQYGKAAADGQMGCIMKMYRDWQLSGDVNFLKELWPNVKRTLEFCWIEGGWDADEDGVMEGCQHNTMDVEYYGPNPQMGIWYLGALRSGEELARYLGEADFANKCNALFNSGKTWIEKNLFNGEYYEHQIWPPDSATKIADGLRHNMGAQDIFKPDYQLGSACLVDQLVGQYMAHICGLGYLLDQNQVQTTLQNIMKYNLQEGIYTHFNNMRSFALGNESALLMASYPADRPRYPFPYFNEAMTGFEYTAAVGMFYEGQLENGLRCIQNIRDRYDGKKRSPFDEAECGHHYARAMASWAGVLALTGFNYSGVENALTLSPNNGNYFWSNGYSWGRYLINVQKKKTELDITVLKGNLNLKRIHLKNFGSIEFEEVKTIGSGEKLTTSIYRM